MMNKQRFMILGLFSLVALSLCISGGPARVAGQNKLGQAPAFGVNPKTILAKIQQVSQWASYLVRSCPLGYLL